MIINAEKIEDIIRETFDDKLASDFSLQISDEKYFCPSIDNVKLLIEKNTVDRLQYTDELFDCDDYAMLLKAHFIKSAYKNKKRRYPYSVGIIMGDLLGDIPHAINFVITEKLKLLFIEPQNDTITSPTKSDAEIFFVYI